MQYVVISIAEARAHGIEILPTQRQSNDKTKAVIHANMVAGIDVFNQLKRYQFDDPEFIELLNSPEWAPEEGVEVPDENFGKVMAAQLIKDEITTEINTFNLEPEDALQVVEMYPEWKTGIEVKIGEIYRVELVLWECIKEHTTQENWKPGVETASLWKAVDVEHEGTLEDPIIYTPPMQLYKDKYYKQNDIVYKCTRDSEIPLSHDLSALVGTYVELV